MHVGIVHSMQFTKCTWESWHVDEDGVGPLAEVLAEKLTEMGICTLQGPNVSRCGNTAK